jgi:membrane fusion protein, heavy metal efflux system
VSRPAPAVLAVLLAAACRARAADRTRVAAAVPAGEVRFEPGSPQLAYLTVDTVRTERERVVAVLPAELVMDENHTVRVASPVSGRVLTVDVQLGDRVVAGQALAHIASGDVAQAQSELAKAEAALTVTTAAQARARDLYEHRVIALKDLQQAESDEAQARAERDRALAHVRLLGGASDSVSQVFLLRCPIAGTVVERTLNPGAEVRADNPQPLVTVTALDTLWLTASVYQRDLGVVRTGQRFLFTTDALPGQRFAARVSYVSGALVRETRTATVRAAVANPTGALKPSMVGEARLYTPAGEGVAVVPDDALVTRGAETVVFVQLEPGRYARRAVTVGDDDGESAVVTSGLRPGELVVTRGSLLLGAEADRAR